LRPVSQRPDGEGSAGESSGSGGGGGGGGGKAGNGTGQTGDRRSTGGTRGCPLPPVGAVASTPRWHHLAAKSSTLKQGSLPRNQALQTPECWRMSTATSCQSLSMAKRTSYTVAAATPADVAATPVRHLRDLAAQIAASVVRRKKVQRDCSDGGGRQADGSSASSTATERGGRWPPSMRSHTSHNHRVAPSATGQQTNAWDRVSGWPSQWMWEHIPAPEAD
jgi:hypothetical protein